MSVFLVASDILSRIMVIIKYSNSTFLSESRTRVTLALLHFLVASSVQQMSFSEARCTYIAGNRVGGNQVEANEQEHNIDISSCQTCNNHDSYSFKSIKIK